jgi:predicted nucleic acid-binding protein
MSKDYLIYLDVCCLNRPFDDQKQDRIRLETEAIIIILNKCTTETWQLVTSNAIETEIANISDREKLKQIIQILSIARSRILVNPTIANRTLELNQLGFSAYDAAHIASAEEAKADILLTTDDRLLKRSLRYADILKVQLANPLYWLANITQEGD